MHDSPFTIAVACTALLGSLTSVFIAIFKRGRKEGMDTADKAMFTYQLNTVKSETDILKAGMVEYGKHVATQGVINAAQGSVNALREERERDFERRISTMEGRQRAK